MRDKQVRRWAHDAIPSGRGRENGGEAFYQQQSKRRHATDTLTSHNADSHAQRYDVATRACIQEPARSDWTHPRTRHTLDDASLHHRAA